MKLTLQEAKDRFVSTGNCDHDEDYTIEFSPYGCENIWIKQCTVCGEVLAKEYVNLT